MEYDDAFSIQFLLLKLLENDFVQFDKKENIIIITSELPKLVSIIIFG